MMTAQSMLSKRPVLRIPATVFLLLFKLGWINLLTATYNSLQGGVLAAHSESTFASKKKGSYCIVTTKLPTEICLKRSLTLCAP